MDNQILIQKQLRSTVFYNQKTDTFIKIFTPKFTRKLKFFFFFRKYPGKNFYFIAKTLKSLNLNTLEIVNFSNYQVETKNLHGISLNKYFETNPNCQNIINQYINFVTCLLKNDIYCGDLSFENFIVKNDTLYAIDLEDYRKVMFLKRSKKEFLRRLKPKIPKYVFHEILSNC